MTKRYVEAAVELLRRLVATPSVSRDEKGAADLMEAALSDAGLSPRREKNNVWSVAPGYDASRPTLLLNAHVDTVKPVASWSRDPFSPDIEGGRLYGLGSNDCGGGLVTLLQVYRHLAATRQGYNLVYLASAEEEVSGANGVSHVLPLLPPIDLALVGEPNGVLPIDTQRRTKGWSRAMDDDFKRKERAFTSLCTCERMMENTSSLVYSSLVRTSMTARHTSGTTLCCVPALSTVTLISVGPSRLLTRSKR